jgi:hypothetical protein
MLKRDSPKDNVYLLGLCYVLTPARSITYGTSLQLQLQVCLWLRCQEKHIETAVASKHAIRVSDPVCDTCLLLLACCSSSNVLISCCICIVSCLQVEQMEEVERAFVHVDYMRRWVHMQCLRCAALALTAPLKHTMHCNCDSPAHMPAVPPFVVTTVCEADRWRACAGWGLQHVKMLCLLQEWPLHVQVDL